MRNSSRPISRAGRCLAIWSGIFAAWAGHFFQTADAADAAAFRFVEAAGTVSVYELQSPVLAYNFGIQTKAGVPNDRARACYIHPLYGLDGETLTDDFPRDHYHHRGLFWAWPHVRIAGQEYDLWMLRGIRQQFERWTEQSAGASTARQSGENGWYVGERKVLREDFSLVIHRATTAGRRIDIELVLRAIGEPVTLWGAAGKSYGGLSLRFAPRQATTITTADGVQPHDLNLTRLAGADLSGRFAQASAVSGVTLLVAPDHADFPPQWITRHYGFLGVGWPGERPFTLEPGRAATLRYALWIHRGPADKDALASFHNP